MSSVISGMCQMLRTGNTREAIVVDAGDGKGYLSSHLALKYKLKVLGVDARPTNTIGAINRLEKVEVYIIIYMLDVVNDKLICIVSFYIHVETMAEYRT